MEKTKQVFSIPVFARRSNAFSSTRPAIHTSNRPYLHVPEHAIYPWR
jgi:hypothetical protein